MGLFSRNKTIFVDSDVLVIGGGMAGCGATYEARYWGRDLNIVCVEKANIERSGAVAQGLYVGSMCIMSEGHMSTHSPQPSQLVM